MKPTRIVKVTKPFIDAFLNAAGVKVIKAVRESTQVDNNLWYQARIEAQENMFDGIGDAIIAPRNIWVDLTDKLITAPQTRVKVPFTNDSYSRASYFTNYGSITVFSEESTNTPQTLYMPSDEIKILKILMEMPQFQHTSIA